MTNITPETIVAIQEMVKTSFTFNAITDRAKSILSAKFAYNQTGDKIHLEIGHKYPIEYADNLGDLIEAHNVPIVYGDIPIQNTDYSSVKELLESLLEGSYEYQNKLNMCAKIAFENMDLHVYQGILPLIEMYNKIVEQYILLVDKINLYGDNPSFDTDIESFWIL